MKTVCILNGGPAYERMFIKRGWDVVYHPGYADLIQFCGGSDVSPALYGEERHERTMPNNPLRDKREERAYRYCEQNGIPMAGICRGAQFLNVMCGGLLYQDVDNHTQSHDIIVLEDAEVLTVTSTHHQMMRPTPEARVLAVAHPKVATRKQYMYEGKLCDDEDFGEDIEVLFYEKQRCFCFQPHPEMFIGSMQDYYFNCLEKYLGV